jgi:hypothetical protein
MTTPNKQQQAPPPSLPGGLPPGITWSPSEAAGVNEFLNSPLGRKWLGILLIRKPRIELAGTERAALTGAFAAGYEYVFGEIAATRMAVTQSDTGGLRSIDPTKD